MISETALKHFDKIWRLFDRRMLDAKGSMFLIEPFEKYLSKGFVENLTQENARAAFRQDMLRWGEIEQREHEIRQVKKKMALLSTTKFEGRSTKLEATKKTDGKLRPKQFKVTEFVDEEVRWARRFIVSAFYNLCCLAAHKKTIEELIWQAWQYVAIQETHPPKKCITAYYRLLGISNLFLIAEWAKDIFFKAIANSDTDFFKGMRRWLIENTPEKRFSTARQWLGVTMLWYLGGKDITPRRDFILLLKQKDIISTMLDEYSFNAQLRKLRLIK
jgi:hypothetical protein